MSPANYKGNPMGAYTGQAFIRRRHVMMRENGSIYETCSSISEAKRMSRNIQSMGGTVRVDHTEDPKPKRKRDTGDAADKFIRKKMREEQAAKVAAEQERKRGPNTLSLKPA